jgi:hypothetical protein
MHMLAFDHPILLRSLPGIVETLHSALMGQDRAYYVDTTRGSRFPPLTVTARKKKCAPSHWLSNITRGCDGWPAKLGFQHHSCLDTCISGDVAYHSGFPGVPLPPRLQSTSFSSDWNKPFRPDCDVQRLASMGKLLLRIRTRQTCTLL